MLKKIRKPKSIRKTLTGKRVKIKSHASPALRKRVGTVLDVVKCAKFIVVRVDAITRYKEGDSAWQAPLAASKIVVMQREGLELV